MSAGKRVRWECPAGDHPGVLGSTRPPKDATVRFCLPCSEAAGRLVLRTAPALERQRAAKAASRQQREAAKRERDRQREAAKFVVTAADGETLDLKAEMDAMIRGSEELRRLWRLAAPSMTWRPFFEVRRGSKDRVSGRAWYHGRIVLTVGAGADSHEIREVLAHELCHIVCPGEHHGSGFRTTLCRVARELFGTSVHPDDHRQAYGLDDLILQQMRRGTGRTTEVR